MSAESQSKRAATPFFLGVDGGGSKTIAAVADQNGQIVSEGRSGGSNYQSAGEVGARLALEEAIHSALNMAQIPMEAIAAAGLGISGLDHDKERRIVEGIVDQILPVRLRFLENDALLVVRAAFDAGVGVGIVAGTGTNCVGLNRKMDRVQIGGMGLVSGDVGFASDLALRTIAGAWRSADGRAPLSVLSAAVLDRFRVKSWSDLEVSWPPAGDEVRDLVQILFVSAGSGDVLALQILEEVAIVLASSASAAIRGLALAGADRRLALGGAMFQLPEARPFCAVVEQKIRQAVPGVEVRVLSVAPVVGGLLFARDQLGPTPGAFSKALFRSALDDGGRALGNAGIVR